MEDETKRIHEEIEGLRQMTTAQLKAKYREVFGEQSQSNRSKTPVRTSRVCNRFRVRRICRTGPL